MRSDWIAWSVADAPDTVSVPQWFAVVGLLGPALITGVLAWLAGRSADTRAKKLSRSQRERIAVTAVAHSFLRVVNGRSRADYKATFQADASDLIDSVDLNLSDLPKKLRAEASIAASGIHSAAMGWALATQYDVPSQTEQDFFKLVSRAAMHEYANLTEWRLEKADAISKEHTDIVQAPAKYISSYVSSVTEKLKSILDALESAPRTSIDDLRDKDNEVVAQLHEVFGKERIDSILNETSAKQKPESGDAR